MNSTNSWLRTVLCFSSIRHYSCGHYENSQVSLIYAVSIVGMVKSDVRAMCERFRERERVRVNVPGGEGVDGGS